MTVSDLSVNSTAVYACNEGFELSGSAIRICQGIEWSGEEPQCAGIYIYVYL